ncbi:hypothetical protein HanIR_Chr16g0831161 [Helianthus annuus]|nr:hypothetical protein HanIR_Chr16g0831161 [Helianthus annuus]
MPLLEIRPLGMGHVKGSSPPFRPVPHRPLGAILGTSVGFWTPETGQLVGPPSLFSLILYIYIY